MANLSFQTFYVQNVNVVVPQQYQIMAVLYGRCIETVLVLQHNMMKIGIFVGDDIFLLVELRIYFCFLAAQNEHRVSGDVAKYTLISPYWKNRKSI